MKEKPEKGNAGRTTADFVRSFLLPFAAGIVAGAAAGLLYAPAKGTDTRKKVSDGAANVALRVRNAAASGTTLYGSGALNAKNRIERLFEAVTAGVEEAKRVREKLEAERL
ncbi:MAG TPA: YtxH domain-containing protein [bacterium]|nr:YtxH domain-containing protein [bacterium]